MYTLLIAFFLLALICSFFCSLWEAVLLSTTPSQARLQTKDGTRVGRYLDDFKANIDRPIAAILTLNTIAHTVGAFGVGAQAAVLWGDSYPWIIRFAVPAVLTVAILVLSEIVPKTLGALYWKQLMTFTAHSLRLLVQALAPFVWLSQYATQKLKSDKSQPLLTRPDFLAMAELGAEEGVFEASESEMISNMIQFQEIQVGDVMTPRTVVSVVSETEVIVDYFDTVKNEPFSRIPVHDESKDHITGYVLKTDLLVALVDGCGDQPVSTLRREIVAVEETFAITDLFAELRERKEHLAVVLDEFGGMAGIVTMEDVLETLLGLEIVDETDDTVDMRELARRHRTRRAKALGLLNGPEGQQPSK